MVGHKHRMLYILGQKTTLNSIDFNHCIEPRVHGCKFIHIFVVNLGQFIRHGLIQVLVYYECRSQS